MNPNDHATFAAILACAFSTVDLRTAITFSGSSALKIAVPATITLLPKVTEALCQ